MSFGRPVEPPEVGAFHSRDTASGRGESSAGPPRSAPTHLRPAISAPTTSTGSASSMTAASSVAGSRADTGCGVAPSFQTATQAWTNARPFGRAIVTMRPADTPSPA